MIRAKDSQIAWHFFKYILSPPYSKVLGQQMREQQPRGLGPHQSFRSKLSTSTQGFHCFFFFFANSRSTTCTWRSQKSSFFSLLTVKPPEVLRVPSPLDCWILTNKVTRDREKSNFRPLSAITGPPRSPHIVSLARCKDRTPFPCTVGLPELSFT